MKSRIVLFAFCVALLSSCGNKGNGTGQVPEYAVQELQKTTANLTTAYPATIKGKQDVEIRPQVSGFITKLCVDEGATVRKGQVLFIVDPTQYEAAVRTAKAAVATAEAAVSTQQMTYDNKKELNKKQIISDYDLAMAENSLAQTKAQLAQAKAQEVSARNNLSYTVVVAPCDGKLGRRSLEEGQFIAAGQTITYILPNTQKWIVANYKETQIENLSIGQEVSVTVDAISDKEFKGKVTSISGATGSKYSLVPTDNSAGNFVKIQQRIPVRIDFTDLSKEDNERLAAGMMVVVKAKF